MVKKILIVVSILFTICCIGAGWYAWDIYSIKYEASEAKRIYIPSGASADMVKDTIFSHFGEEYGAWVFRLWDYDSNGKPSPGGSFVIEPGTRAVNAARMISRGAQTPVRVTINNMRTLEDLANQLASKLEPTSDEFIQAIEKDSTYTLMELYPSAFLPDTYEFYWNTTPENVIAKLIDIRNSFWNEERKAKADKLGLTPEEVATVASIVEEESNRSDERPIIARLYLNRLDKRMKLQADPTVKFAVGDFTLRRVLEKHLKIDSPYNTYKYAGLPPGPIRIVEKSTLDAVLNAPQHNYLYMCAKEDFSGRHNFAADYDTHLRNARRYQAELNRRGIK